MAMTLEDWKDRYYEAECRHSEFAAMSGAEHRAELARLQARINELELASMNPVATPEQVTNMARALARIREIADFPNTPGADMLPDMMGRLESIFQIANGESVPARLHGQIGPPRCYATGNLCGTDTTMAPFNCPGTGGWCRHKPQPGGTENV